MILKVISLLQGSARELKMNLSSAVGWMCGSLYRGILFVMPNLWRIILRGTTPPAVGIVFLDEGEFAMTKRRASRMAVLALTTASCLFQFGGCSAGSFFRNVWTGFGVAIGGAPAQLILDAFVLPLLNPTE